MSETQTPTATELINRSLNYLTQAETTLDEKDPTQNALIGIGYAILADAQAIRDGIEPQPRGWYMGDGIARDLSGKPFEPLDWDYLRR